VDCRGWAGKSALAVAAGAAVAAVAVAGPVAGPGVGAFGGVADSFRTAVGAQTAAWYQRVGSASATGPLGRVVVERKRGSRDGRWVFGGAVAVPGGSGGAPVPVLFLARWDGRAWRVGVQGSAAFAAAARDAPDAVVRPEERRSFAARPAPTGRAEGYGSGLALPWAAGHSWGGGQVHGNTGAPRPFNAIDFYGGDGRVRASASGRLYRFCTGTTWPMLFVVHDNGLTTGYYHLQDETDAPDGSWVSAGEYLGQVGMELPCGGFATRPHVHWTLWQAGNPVPVDGHTIGGWTWHEGASAYGGYAEHAGIRVNAGDCCHLRNYGT
jgi:LasA protease